MLASVPKEDDALLEPLRSLGCGTTHDNLEVVRQSEVVVLGVKPHVVPRVAEGLKDRGTGQLLVSVAAGQSLSDAAAPLVVDLSVTVSPVGWFQSSRMNNVTGSL